MLTLQQIITEADTLVPNAFTSENKVSWLNAINQDFFSVVKIPKIANFTSTKGTSIYTLAGNIKDKNIDKVMVGHLKFMSANYEDIQPQQNWFSFNESGNVLTLSVPVNRNGDLGVVRYHKAPSTTFTADGISTQKPDAPDEYHWIYVLGLARYIAEGQNDIEKVSNYDKQYRDALNVASQEFQGRSPA